MGKYIILCIALLCNATVYAQGNDADTREQAYSLLSKQQKDSLKTVINNMMVNDQKYRWMLMLGEMDANKLAELRKLESKEQYMRMKDVGANKVGISKVQKDSIGQLQDDIDKYNFKTICNIIYKYGIPQNVDVIKVTTILQHNSFLIGEQFLGVLMQEVKNDHFPPMEYAIIYDNTQTARKLPELYCTSDYFDAETKTVRATVPKDLAATNKARKEIGLKKWKG